MRCSLLKEALPRLTKSRSAEEIHAISLKEALLDKEEESEAFFIEQLFGSFPSSRSGVGTDHRRTL